MAQTVTLQNVVEGESEIESPTGILEHAHDAIETDIRSLTLLEDANATLYVASDGVDVDEQEVVPVYQMVESEEGGFALEQVMVNTTDVNLTPINVAEPAEVNEVETRRNLD